MILPCGSAGIRVIHQPLSSPGPLGGVLARAPLNSRDFWPSQRNWKGSQVVSVRNPGMAGQSSGCNLRNCSRCFSKEPELSLEGGVIVRPLWLCPCSPCLLTLQPHGLPGTAGPGDTEMDLIAVCHSGYFQLSLGSSSLERNGRLDIGRHLVLLTDRFHQQMPVIIQKINYLLFSLGNWARAVR